MTGTPEVKTRLILRTPPIEDAAHFAPLLEAACREGDIAAVILPVPDGNASDSLSAIRTITGPMQERGIAVLLAGRPSLVESAGADGAHFSTLEELQSNRAKLAAGRLSGVGGLQSRHEAMTAADSGIDYVMFGEPDGQGKRPGFSALVERVAWWAEIFQLPCVAYAGSIEEVRELAEARADFILLDEAVWSLGEGAPEAVASAMQFLKSEDAAA